MRLDRCQPALQQQQQQRHLVAGRHPPPLSLTQPLPAAAPCPSSLTSKRLPRKQRRRRRQGRKAAKQQRQRCSRRKRRSLLRSWRIWAATPAWGPWLVWIAAYAWCGPCKLWWCRAATLPCVAAAAAVSTGVPSAARTLCGDSACTCSVRFKHRRRLTCTCCSVLKPLQNWVAAGGYI